jgi:predicted RNase H-like HicB family nuclease
MKELPAAITQGRTKKEAMENIKEAIELVLEDGSNSRRNT